MDEDILYLIPKYGNLETAKKFSKIISLRSLNERLKYCRTIPFYCTKCARNREEHIARPHFCYRCEACKSFSRGTRCISDHLRNEKFYLCETCEIYYLCCKKCSNEKEIYLYQFLGFDINPSKNKINTVMYRIINQSVISRLINNYDFFRQFLKNGVLEFNNDDFRKHKNKEKIYEILSELPMKYDVSDLGLEYFDVNNFSDRHLISHYWYCRGCHTKYSDKKGEEEEKK